MSNLLDSPTGKGLACFTVLAKLMPAKVAEQVLRYGVSTRKLVKAVQAMTDVLDDVAPATMPASFTQLLSNVRRTGDYPGCQERFELQEQHFAFDARWYGVTGVHAIHYQANPERCGVGRVDDLIRRHDFRRVRIEQAFAFVEVCDEEYLRQGVVALLDPGCLRASVGRDVVLEFHAERRQLNVSLTFVDDRIQWMSNSVFLAQAKK